MCEWRGGAVGEGGGHIDCASAGDAASGRDPFARSCFRGRCSFGRAFDPGSKDTDLPRTPLHAEASNLQTDNQLDAAA